MTGYQVWKIHRAIKLHFTNKRYDIFQYNGRFRKDTEDAFAKVRNRVIYEFLSSKFEKPRDCVDYFLSNLIYSVSDESLGINGWDNYRRWIREKESLSKLISDDLDKINLSSDLFDDQMPRLLKLIVSGKIMPQTAIAIDATLPFLTAWTSKVYFGFEESVLKLTKLSRFVKYNTEQISQLILEKQSETK